MSANSSPPDHAAQVAIPPKDGKPTTPVVFVPKEGDPRKRVPIFLQEKPPGDPKAYVPGEQPGTFRELKPKPPAPSPGPTKRANIVVPVGPVKTPTMGSFTPLTVFPSLERMECRVNVTKLLCGSRRRALLQAAASSGDDVAVADIVGSGAGSITYVQSAGMATTAALADASSGTQDVAIESVGSAASAKPPVAVFDTDRDVDIGTLSEAAADTKPTTGDRVEIAGDVGIAVQSAAAVNSGATLPSVDNGRDVAITSIARAAVGSKGTPVSGMDAIGDVTVSTVRPTAAADPGPDSVDTGGDVAIASIAGALGRPPNDASADSDVSITSIREEATGNMSTPLAAPSDPDSDVTIEEGGMGMADATTSSATNMLSGSSMQPSSPAGTSNLSPGSAASDNTGNTSMLSSGATGSGDNTTGSSISTDASNSKASIANAADSSPENGTQSGRLPNPKIPSIDDPHIILVADGEHLSVRDAVAFPVKLLPDRFCCCHAAGNGSYDALHHCLCKSALQKWLASADKEQAAQPMPIFIPNNRLGSWLPVKLVPLDLCSATRPRPPPPRIKGEEGGSMLQLLCSCTSPPRPPLSLPCLCRRRELLAVCDHHLLRARPRGLHLPGLCRLQPEQLAQAGAGAVGRANGRARRARAGARSGGDSSSACAGGAGRRNNAGLRHG